MPLQKGWKRMNINIRAELFNQFKSAVAAQGKTITQVLLEFVEDYIRKQAPRPGITRVQPWRSGMTIRCPIRLATWLRPGC